MEARRAKRKESPSASTTRRSRQARSGGKPKPKRGSPADALVILEVETLFQDYEEAMIQRLNAMLEGLADMSDKSIAAARVELVSSVWNRPKSGLAARIVDAHLANYPQYGQAEARKTRARCRKLLKKALSSERSQLSRLSRSASKEWRGRMRDELADASDRALEYGDRMVQTALLKHQMRAEQASQASRRVIPAGSGQAPARAMCEPEGVCEGSGNDDDDSLPILTDRQSQIMKCLNKQALTGEEIARSVTISISTTKEALRELKELGFVKNKRGLGYYRPDAPPEQK